MAASNNNTRQGRSLATVTRLLRYLQRRFSEGDPSDPAVCMVHDEIRSGLDIRDRRTWLKYLRRLEDERLVTVCYGKNQYVPTVVRPGVMLWHDGQEDGSMPWHGCVAESKMPWHDNDRHRAARHLRHNDAMAHRGEADASQRRCHGTNAAKTMACTQRTRKINKPRAMASPRKHAMALSEECAMAYSSDCLKTQKICKKYAIARTDAMAYSFDALKKSEISGFHAMAYGMPWHESAVSLSCGPESGFDAGFVNILFASDLENPDNDRYIINTKYSLNSKFIKHIVGSVLSSIDGGENPEKVTHTQFCSAKTERGRRKEKSGGGRLTAAARPSTLPVPGMAEAADMAVHQDDSGTVVLKTDGGDSSVNVWLQWVRQTAHRLTADETAFGAFSDKWLARARLNGKLAKYQTHSIKDFIIQDFMKEQTEKCNESAVAAAINAATGSMPVTKTIMQPSTQGIAPMTSTTATQQGLRIPRGVTLTNFNLWGSLKDKQMELRGIAANYEHWITQLLRGREIGCGTLMELHDIFRLNVPGYAARYPGVGHDDNRGYKAAEQWIFELARHGFSPRNILQQAGFEIV